MFEAQKGTKEESFLGCKAKLELRYQIFKIWQTWETCKIDNPEMSGGNQRNPDLLQAWMFH